MQVSANADVDKQVTAKAAHTGRTIASPLHRAKLANFSGASES
jgi:hypothetical protein